MNILLRCPVNSLILDLLGAVVGCNSSVMPEQKMLLKFHRLPIHGQSSDLAGNLWDHESRLNEASCQPLGNFTLDPASGSVLGHKKANSSLFPMLHFTPKAYYPNKLTSLSTMRIYKEGEVERCERI